MFLVKNFFLSQIKGKSIKCGYRCLKNQYYTNNYLSGLAEDVSWLWNVVFSSSAFIFPTPDAFENFVIFPSGDDFYGSAS